MKALVVILALGLGVPALSLAQSAPNDSIVRRNALGPAALSPFSAGNAARTSGRRYERGPLSSWLQTVGGTLMFGAVVTRFARHCKGAPFDDEHQCKVIDEVFLGGLAVYMSSFGFSWRPGDPSTGKLVWRHRALWH